MPKEVVMTDPPKLSDHAQRKLEASIVRVQPMTRRLIDEFVQLSDRALSNARTHNQEVMNHFLVERGIIIDTPLYASLTHHVTTNQLRDVTKGDPEAVNPVSVLSVLVEALRSVAPRDANATLREIGLAPESTLGREVKQYTKLLGDLP